MIHPSLCFGQETDITIENTDKEKKVSYSFFTEYGLSAGVWFDDRHKTTLDVTGVFVNNICFNKKQDMIGVGIGLNLYYLILAQAVPVFVNYRHNFSSKTNLEPLINVALGTQIDFWGGTGFYSTIAGGFRYKGLSFNLGIFIKSWGEIFSNEADYYGGVEFKLGYIFLK